MDNSYKVSCLYPNVSKITIAAIEVYPCAVTEREIKKDFGIAIYNPDSLVSFTYNCINKDCTRNNFDLYRIVSTMVSHKEESKNGAIYCEGNESRDHNHKCPCELIYSITIDFRD